MLIPAVAVYFIHFIDLFYTGETNGTQTLQSITCPICGSLGFTEGTLITHVSQAHPSHSHEVVSLLTIKPAHL